MKVPLLSAAVVLLGAGAAQAQEFVRADCAGVVRASAALAYENDEHRAWYRRFWTGDCKGLPLRCMPGNPNWNDLVADLAKKAGPDRAAAVTREACRMGQTIGYEWSRPKPVRRIDTNDLKAFMKTLDAAPDVDAGMARVDGQVKVALGG